MGLGLHEFGSDIFIGFTICRGPFRMTNNNVAGTKILEHGSTDFTGVWAHSILTKVLRTPGNRTVMQHGLRLSKIRIRHADHYLSSMQCG